MALLIQQSIFFWYMFHPFTFSPWFCSICDMLFSRQGILLYCIDYQCYQAISDKPSLSLFFSSLFWIRIPSFTREVSTFCIWFFIMTRSNQSRLKPAVWHICARCRVMVWFYMRLWHIWSDSFGRRKIGDDRHGAPFKDGDYLFVLCLMTIFMIIWGMQLFMHVLISMVV